MSVSQVEVYLEAVWAYLSEDIRSMVLSAVRGESLLGKRGDVLIGPLRAEQREYIEWLVDSAARRSAATDLPFIQVRTSEMIPPMVLRVGAELAGFVVRRVICTTNPAEIESRYFSYYEERDVG